MPWLFSRRDNTQQEQDVEAVPERPVHPQQLSPAAWEPYWSQQSQETDSNFRGIWAACGILLLFLSGLLPLTVALCLLFLICLLASQCQRMTEERQMQQEAGRRNAARLPGSPQPPGTPQLHAPGIATPGMEFLQWQLDSEQQRAAMLQLLRANIGPTGRLVLTGSPAQLLGIPQHHRLEPEPLSDEALAQLLSFPFAVRKGEAPAADAEGCSICLEPYAEGVQVTMLPCAHLFHEGCVQPWLRQGGLDAVCPLCKHPAFREVPAG